MKTLTNIIRVLLLLLAAPMAVKAEPNILVLNSNQSVEKYLIVQESFVSSLAQPVSVLDLATQQQLIVAEEAIGAKSFDIIYCIGSRAFNVAHQKAPTANVIFSAIINWKRLPMRDKTYGISNELHPLMQMTLFRYIFPEIKKIGLLYDERFNHEWFDQASMEAKNVGIELMGRAISDANQAGPALKKLLTEVEAYWLISDPTIISGEKTLLNLMELCDGKQVPIFSYNEVFAKYGAVLIVSLDEATVGRQAAGIAGSIITGAAIGEKVQLPVGSRVVLNLNKIRKYRLRYSVDALANVNRIIE